MNNEETASLTSKEQWQVLKRLLSYLKPHKRSLIIALLFLMITVIGDIAGPYIIKIFMDDYLTPRYFPKNPLIILGITFMGIQLVNVLISYLQMMRFQKLALNVIQQLRIDVYQKIHLLGMRYFDRTPSGSIVSRVTNDTEAIKDMFVTVLIGFVQSGFLIIGVYIAMFSLNIKLALVTLILLPILFIIIQSYRKYSAIFYMDMRERLSQLNAKIAESLQGMSIVQAFRQESRFRDEFDEINEKHFRATMSSIKLDSLMLRPIIDVVYAFALILLLSFFGITSFHEPVEIGVIYAFVTYINRFFEPINQVMDRLSLLQQAIVSASRVFTLLDDPEIDPKQKNNEKLQVQEGRIEFKDVSFSYDDKTDVLKHISFTVNPGETVALVGHTGSGKSSIINLLMRFYEFNRGNILIDGESIKEYPKQELREQMGLVLQDPFLFYGTIASNIRLYNNCLTEEDVKSAAEFVQAHEFIEHLPDQYNHKVTERGSTFSSGQKQLIAFARTIATNPKILILDEATATIDTETEVAIQKSLEKMRQGRTTIAIAHRLSTIQDAEQILVLHQGEIVERGTHKELLLQKGLYHKMYQLQNGIVNEIESF
ncbi:ABC transporter ATP-binding protein [Rummeliibacillus pycnus]|uniref:ABC transporter ATP-binding protein n=1 Tax=Rummeliibacillus pycnus TaxID=101070 RepID=UPI003D2CA715